ncbi:NAD-dependent epimerase/dehydratase family protein [Candidatus Pelagibacter sp.]|nr:NAD-dependent epimerase/dehydratase family protein [Candidatus Pelagibacter sp.]|tara:strand:+ start:3322 stop:4251 length:930 start_codon:yes stop_codon:yes gene_type:complete
MKKTNIIITGGLGNIGSSFVKKLVNNKKYFLYIVDNLYTGSLSKLPSKKYKNWKFFKLNVNSKTELNKSFKNIRIDYIFHFAALVGVSRTLMNPKKVFKDIDGIKNILQLALKKKIKKYFFSSSSEVYGETTKFPQNENNTPLNSRLPYSVVKNLGELCAKNYLTDSSINYTIFRFFNTYGPAQNDDFVIPNFIKLAKKNKPILINGDGSQTRTFCYIDDNIDCCVKIFKKNLLNNQIINIGSNKEITILSLAKKIIKILNSKSKIYFRPKLKEGDMARRFPEIKKMKKILNRRMISLDKGIIKTSIKI